MMDYLPSLSGRSLLKDSDLNCMEILDLVGLARLLRDDRRMGFRRRRLEGRAIALVFEKPSTRTRSAFEVAAHDEGGHVTYIGPDESQLGYTESVKDTARVLGRMFDGIEYRGYSQESAEILGCRAGVPVWNGLTDSWHPTQLLADVMTMQDSYPGDVQEATVCFLGDGRNNVASSLQITGALLGMDIRICAPSALQPAPDVQATADALASRSGGSLTVTDDVTQAVAGADFIYTDVWLSMGDSAADWDKRIDLLLPYQVNAKVMAATSNPQARFMHCLPALHNLETGLGRQIHDRRGLSALEVTDDVFEGPQSSVFEQAENRMHTIKALMLATIGIRD